MKELSLKVKILLLVLIPLVLVSVALTCLAILQANTLGSNNLKIFSEKIYDLRRNELKNYTEMAVTAVSHIHNENNKNSIEAQESAKTILRNLAYGSDGYIFVYDYEGTNVVLPTKPHIEGKNLWNISDKNGVLLIQELVSNAKQGGGYTEYIWDKPSKGSAIDKISYSLGLEQWQWMVGTGLYVDDLDDAIAVVKQEVDDNIGQTLQLISGLAIICTLVVGFIVVRFTVSEGKLADEKLQQLSVKAVTGQEEERARVARELQKGINQTLVIARAKLDKLSQENANNQPELQSKLAMVSKALSLSIKEIYRISGELRPESLDKLGLSPAIEALSEQISKEHNIQLQYRFSGSESRIEPEMETSLFRIVQEAYKNIVDHASATQVNTRLNQKAHAISITIQDNGQGFSPKAIESRGSKAGLGIIDMRIRAESLGGTFTVFSSEGTGTVIKIEIPF